MSTIGHSNWNIDLAELGAIYPLQGYELPMVILGVIFWIAWHRLQFKQEQQDLDQAANSSNNPEEIINSIDRF